MAHDHPRLTANDARVVSTNTIHNVRLRDPRRTRSLCAIFYNTLTLLSAELGGRSYSGGILKLEPADAERLLVPRLPIGAYRLLPKVDAYVRARDREALLDYVDDVALAPLALTPHELGRLRSALAFLRERRQQRNHSAS